MKRGDDERRRSLDHVGWMSLLAGRPQHEHDASESINPTSGITSEPLARRSPSPTKHKQHKGAALCVSLAERDLRLLVSATTEDDDYGCHRFHEHAAYRWGLRDYDRQPAEIARPAGCILKNLRQHHDGWQET
jgi:hypothetical protein